MFLNEIFDIHSHCIEEADGFFEFVGGFGGGEAGEVIVEGDVVAVAGEEEFLAEEFDGGDAAAGGEDFDFVNGEEGVGGAGQGAEAVFPAEGDLVYFLGGGGLGEFGVGGHAGARAFHVGGGEEGAE